jgi:hypothetical protein
VDAGLYSKLESGGTFNIAEKVLPLADDLKRLSTAKYLLNVPANLLALGAVVLLGGEFALIAAVPDDNAVLLSVQVVTGLLAGGGAVILLATSFLVRGMSLAPAHDNGVELSTVVVEGAPVVGVPLLQSACGKCGRSVRFDDERHILCLVVRIPFRFRAHAGLRLPR